MPAIAVGQVPSMLAVPAPSRASPLPQWFWVFADSGYTHSTCGSWLASDGGGPGTVDVGCAGPIAGKPAPTGGLEVLADFACATANLWALAHGKFVHQEKPGRPVGRLAHPYHSTGRVLARLQLLILIHTPQPRTRKGPQRRRYEPKSMSPALRIACTRLCTLSLRRMAETWALTVVSAISRV